MRNGRDARHAALVYFAMTLALSWLSMAIVVGPAVFLGTESATLAPEVFVAMYAGPLVAGLVLTGIFRGRQGYHDLRVRLLNSRVGAGWYAFALLGFPIVVAGLLGLLSMTSPAFLPTIVASDDKLSVLATGIAAGLATGLCEEIGWTGFATPAMRKRHSVFHTGLIIGLVWGAWHYPLFASSGASSPPLLRAMLVLALLFSFLPPFRILMVWAHERTTSLFIVVLMHVSLTATTIILQPLAVEGVTALTYDLLVAAVLWGLALAVTSRSSTRHALGSTPRGHQPTRFGPSDA